MFEVNRVEALQRPTLTYELIYAPSQQGILADPYQPCLLETKEFLRLFEHVCRMKVSRRNLQLYSSPAYRFIPLPIHKGGYKSYYLNPEHTVCLGVALHLQKQHYFPAKAIQRIMREIPEDQYRFILRNVLTGEEILESASLVREGYGIKDVLFKKVCLILEAIDEPYWQAVDKFGKGAGEAHEKHVDDALVSETKRVAEWIRSGRRRRIGRVELGRTEKEAREMISWLHAVLARGRKA